MTIRPRRCPTCRRRQRDALCVVCFQRAITKLALQDPHDALRGQRPTMPPWARPAARLALAFEWSRDVAGGLRRAASRQGEAA